jgi:catechol 2,3-dioxygenase-like lactoylglutathione lyase family enzyme
MTTRRVIVDHVLFVVSDLEASRRFYTAAPAPIGLGELHVQEDGVEGHQVLPRMPVSPRPSPGMSSPLRAGSPRIASNG